MIYLLLTQNTPDIPSLSYGWLFAKMILAMIVIIALALVTLKYLLPRMIKLRQNPNSKIAILDYHSLEPRRSIYVLQIENQKVAVGVTEHGINKICDLEVSP